MQPLNYKTRRLGPLMQWWVGLPSWLSLLVLLGVVLTYGAVVATVTIQALNKYGSRKKNDTAKTRVVTKTITRALPCDDPRHLDTGRRLAKALEGQAGACKDVKERVKALEPCICDRIVPTVKKRRRRRSRKSTSKRKQRRQAASALSLD